MTTSTPNRIAEQNDSFRKAVFYRPQRNGKIVYTRGIASLPEETIKAIFRAIVQFNDFDEADGNNPYGENDFGAVEGIAGEKVFWKIDYYSSPACEYGAENPASPTTYRLLTLMLASEY